MVPLFACTFLLSLILLPSFHGLPTQDAVLFGVLGMHLPFFNCFLCPQFGFRFILFKRKKQKLCLFKVTIWQAQSIALRSSTVHRLKSRKRIMTQTQIWPYTPIPLLILCLCFLFLSPGICFYLMSFLSLLLSFRRLRVNISHLFVSALAFLPLHFFGPCSNHPSALSFLSVPESCTAAVGE